MVAQRGTMRIRYGASAEQLRAVYNVMRILAEDDRRRGDALPGTVPCAACRRGRPAAGSVNYAGTQLCNGCATDYELLRMAGLVDDLVDYLAKETQTADLSSSRTLLTRRSPSPQPSPTRGEGIGRD